MPIPYILWKTSNEPVSSSHIQTILASLSKQNPRYKINYMNDTQCQTFIQYHFPLQVYVAFNCLIPGAYTADLFRYCALFIEGGVYGDIKQKYEYPLDDIIDMQSNCIQWTRDLPRQIKPAVQISFMAAPPRHPIFKKAIQEITNNVFFNCYTCGILGVSGPDLMGKILIECPDTKHTFLWYQYDSKQIRFTKDDKVAIYTKHFTVPSVKSGSYSKDYVEKKVYNTYLLHQYLSKWNEFQKKQYIQNQHIDIKPDKYTILIGNSKNPIKKIYIGNKLKHIAIENKELHYNDVESKEVLTFSISIKHGMCKIKRTDNYEGWKQNIIICL